MICVDRALATSLPSHADSPLQALLVEQALLLARQLETTAAAAPDGQVLAHVKALAVPAARARARQAVPATLQAEATAVEKKGRPTGPVLAAVAAVPRTTPGEMS